MNTREVLKLRCQTPPTWKPWILELLRTLSLVQETGTLARASRRVGRTLSAVSLQLKRLEAQCGRPLFRKAGRRLELNAEGERVLAAGRRMLALNDQLLESLRTDEAETRLRLGVPQDVAERWLPEALARFSRAHPRVQLEVRVESNLAIRQLLTDGGLDLAVTFEREGGPLPSENRPPGALARAPRLPLGPLDAAAAGALRAALHLPPDGARGAGPRGPRVAGLLQQSQPLRALGCGLGRSRRDGADRARDAAAGGPGAIRAAAGTASAGVRRGGRGRARRREASRTLRALLAELLRRAAAARPEHARRRAGRSRAQPRAAR